MKIKRLVIENFGKIDRFECYLEDDINVIDDNDDYDVMLALAGALSYPVSEIGDFHSRIRKGTNIQIFTDKMDDIRRLNEMNITGVSKESLACSIFFNSKEVSFCDRLSKYKEYDDIYGDRKFARITDHFGGSRVFQSFLKEYISTIKPFLLVKGKNIKAELSKEGCFRCVDDYCLSSQEKLLFDLYCFGRLHEFWEEASLLRTLESPNMPLMIGNVFEYLDHDKKRSERVFKRIFDTRSQVLLFN